MIVDHLILCIDDDPDDLMLLKNAFDNRGIAYRIVEAHDGVEGLNALKKIKESGELPCLIVLDINMPKMDGRETFNAIRAIPAFNQIPIVIFSTSSSPLDKLFFAKKNVEYFTKPIKFDHLQYVAGSLLSICEKNSTHNSGGSNA